MGLKTKKILDVVVTVQEKDEILEEIKKYFKKAESGKRKAESAGVKPLVIFTPNPEIINFAQKNIFFREIVNSAQINIPDGAGIVWALKKKENMSIDRISGADFILDLCKLADKNGFTVGLIGGKNGVALKTSECLLEKYKNLKTEVLGEPGVEVRIMNYELGTRSREVAIRNYELEIRNRDEGNRIHNSYFIIHDSSGRKVDSKEYFSGLVKTIGKKKIDILFVALGFPKQEYYIESVKREALSGKIARPLVLMAVGGTFDYISGTITRAPFWVRESGFEWLYRLIRESWRLKRQVAGAGFFFRVLFG